MRTFLLRKNALIKNHEHGGRIRNYDDQNLIMTVGAFGGFVEPQNENSIFGKIIMINKKSKKFKIISKRTSKSTGSDI